MQKTCWFEVDGTVYIDEICSVSDRKEILTMVSSLKIFSDHADLYVATISLEDPNIVSWNQGETGTSNQYSLGETTYEANCWSNDRVKACIWDTPPEGASTPPK